MLKKAARISAIVVVLSVSLVSLFKFTEIGSFRIVANLEPYAFTNSFVDEIYESIKDKASVEPSIVFVQGPERNGMDSLLGVTVERISRFGPSVIAVDYDITDSSLAGKFHIENSVHVVLASVLDESDNVINPLN